MQGSSQLRRYVSVLFASAIALGSVATPAGAAPADPPLGASPGPVVNRSPYGTSVVVDGHGNGHGIGLSQYGALGYAIDDGWSAEQILDRYYGGTSATTIPNADIRVRLVALDDAQTAVVAPQGANTSADALVAVWKSVVARPTATGYAVWAHAEQRCPAASADPTAEGWTRLPDVVGSSVDIVPSAAFNSITAEPAALLAVCEPGGTIRSYRGSIRAAKGTAGEARTVSILPIESYLPRRGPARSVGGMGRVGRRQGRRGDRGAGGRRSFVCPGPGPVQLRRDL